MKILLTGGLGQVGSYLAERLPAGNEVTILDNFSNSLKGLKLTRDVNIINGDIRNRREVNELTGKVDAIIHAAAQRSVKMLYRSLYGLPVVCLRPFNIVKAIFNTMESKKAVGEIFNIATGIPTRIKELAGTIIKVCDMFELTWNKYRNNEFALTGMK